MPAVAGRSVSGTRRYPERLGAALRHLRCSLRSMAPRSQSGLRGATRRWSSPGRLNQLADLPISRHVVLSDRACAAALQRAICSRATTAQAGRALHKCVVGRIDLIAARLRLHACRRGVRHRHGLHGHAGKWHPERAAVQPRERRGRAESRASGTALGDGNGSHCSVGKTEPAHETDCRLVRRDLRRIVLPCDVLLTKHFRRDRSSSCCSHVRPCVKAPERAPCATCRSGWRRVTACVFRDQGNAYHAPLVAIRSAPDRSGDSDEQTQR